VIVVEGESKKLASTASPRSDSGMSFIEVLVSIVLLGTAVVGILVALRAATHASIVDADHSKAIAWLQAGSDAIYEAPRESCTKYNGPGDPFDPENDAADLLANWATKASRVGGAADAPGANTIWGRYKLALASASPPAGWSGASIRIVAIEFLGRPDPNANFFEWGANYCFEGVQPDANGDGDPENYRITPFLAQKVTLEARSPNGELFKRLETVKGEG
jgi:hypothetical protein